MEIYWPFNRVVPKGGAGTPSCFKWTKFNGIHNLIGLYLFTSQTHSGVVGLPPANFANTLSSWDPQGHSEIDHIREFETEPMYQQREMVIRYTNAAGVQRFKGGADLKSSQAYPKRYLEFINMVTWLFSVGSSTCNSNWYCVCSIQGLWLFFQPFGTYDPSVLSWLASHLRFGVALSKVRTRFAKNNKRKAMAFLRDARKGSYKYDLRPRTNHAWMKAGDLQPVLDFLTQKTR
jgi:hypothetical protein